MRALILLSVGLGVGLAVTGACSEDGKKSVDANVNPVIDASPVDGSAIDARSPDASPGSNVEAITCPGGEAATIATSDGVNMYSPNAATITVDQIVKFTMSASHNVVPSAGGDPNLRIGFGETKCLKFTAAGSYVFRCGPHQFTGTITVN